MAGLLDFLLQGGQGGGLLGLGGPQQISPDIQRTMQAPQSSGLFFNPNEGLLGSIRGGLNQIADPEGMQKQRALQNYIALQHLELQRKALEDKPQVVWQEDETGKKVPYRVGAMGGGITQVPIQGAPPPNPNAPPVPPGMDPKVFKKELTEAEVKNQQEAVKSAKAAADIMPLIDEAADAYREVQRLDASGPIVASAPGRYLATGMAALGDATGLGSTSKESEVARQRYDKALAAIQARATAAQNQGLGAVSNFERILYSAQYPSLTALDAGSQQNFWEQMRASARQTIEAAKTSPLSRSPSVSGVLERPPVMPGQGGQTQIVAPQGGPQIAPPSSPIRVQSKAEYDRLPPGSPYVAPDGSIRTKQGNAPSMNPRGLY